MFNYILKRLLQMIPTLIGVSLLSFIILQLVPGDPAELIAGLDASPEEVQIIRERLGTDKPLYEQYFQYNLQLLQGDLGTSMRSDNPVLHEILERFPNTVMLTILATLVTVVIGLVTGVIAATKPGSARDHASMAFSLFGISMPVFWLGIILILVFAYYIPILPSGGSSEFKHFILPALVLGISSAAVLARLTRSSILEVINQDYIRTAKAKGVREWLIIYKHALKNAFVPIITVIGMEIGNLLGGAVLTETVFSMNGLGRYIIQSIQFRDYSAVQGSIIFVAFIFVIINLLVDLCYAAVDPRIRYDRKEA
ncbi:ABC-type dipeptide/oligopeptide/nickel transport system permease component [Paenibacillus amylolyticus]|uniref:ABC-type dipeptide/oligopeptide/nickel transport system permease component n=1 Tax=Paenibacillus amylolyticus TaxID=1451 RepID=A0AAP5LPJ2_PAEAM|nr:ABC transporter permease [Paenibacillus amylolyticus]MDR6724578.1 ABC-type dipeptide/oligopeptide/nickel transport system permease component [Paenibacillus amylolyticus]